ncbi:UDP-N-acetylglucosamine 2-epimerase [Ruminococcaceae bacterium OttesenSCG-928-A16]|nr:UDP-N-acetylglucosamine 2-epimerase [Ruminococcaceae bacterium OttesenSCG-928-A16]
MYTITAVTSTRADYGLLRPVLKKIAASPMLQLKLLVTGSHLAAQHGSTINEIIADEKYGIFIDAEMDILAEQVPEGRLGTAQRTSLALQGALAYFTKQKPNAVLVLGDRYEIFAVSQAAALLNIPVVHISGGDVTHGADDDWFRHCITKLAKLHFPSCEAYRQRLLRMGEQPSTVFNVGGLGDENIRSMQLLPRAELAASLQAEGLPGVPDVLVTFHPETAADTPPMAQLQALFAAVEDFPQFTYLFTGANADAGGDEINRAIQAFCGSKPNCTMVQSLGVLRYLSAMQAARLVLGNSSSGVVETPSFGTPAVNIGHRQDGRIMCANVVCCGAVHSQITAAIQQAITPEFAAQAKQVQSPYNGGDTSGKIVAILQEFLQQGTLQHPKIFYDGKCEE